MQTRLFKVGAVWCGSWMLAAFWSPAADAASAADARFMHLAKDVIEDLLRERPEAATQLGDHRYDDRLTDYSAEALARREETLRRQLAEFERIDLESLTGANRTDAEILRMELEAMLYLLTE